MCSFSRTRVVSAQVLTCRDQAELELRAQSRKPYRKSGLCRWWVRDGVGGKGNTQLASNKRNRGYILRVSPAPDGDRERMATL